MISIPVNPWYHYIGDAAAWIGAAAASRWQHRQWPHQAGRLARTTKPGYFLMLGVGALLGAWFWGSVNTLPDVFTPSHSIAGALAGGIVGVELWKWRHGVRQSTGGAYVLPICVGIIIGRFGCLFAGLPDNTYGIASSLPWAVDLGDGIGRHPVELYEAVSMAVFLVFYLFARFGSFQWAEVRAFHAMIVFYAAQRFAWEWLKPYSAVLGPFNTFHLLMLGLAAYGIIWWRRISGTDATA